MRLLKLILLRSKSVGVAAVLASIISGLLSAGIIVFAKKAVEDPGGAGWWMIGGFFLLGLVAVLSRICSEGLLMNLLQESLYEMRLHLVTSVLQTPLTKVEQIGSPRIIATLTSDVNTVSTAIVGLPLFLLNVTITLACTIIMFTISPLTAVIGMCLLPIGALAHKAIAKGTFARFKHSREKEDDLFERFTELVDGVKDLKLNQDRRDQFLNIGLEDAAQEYKKYKIKGLLYFLTTISLMKYLFYAYLGLVLFVLPSMGLLTSEAIMSAVLVILYGIGPFSSILHWLPNWSQARVALDKIESLGFALDEQAEKERLFTSEANTPHSLDRLTLSGVTYQHPGDQNTNQGFSLGPIDLDLHSGNIVFLVGGNGSGKTTLAKLITGLYYPRDGYLSRDGSRLSPQQLRECYAAVFSDLVLFADLPLGADPSEAESLLEDMGLAHVIRVREGQFTNTRHLSQGQRKRLALVVALLQDKPIYLFDEWAADQDPAFREHFYRQILPELKQRGKLVIAISHDDRWFHLADHVVTMDYGRLRPHQEHAAITL